MTQVLPMPNLTHDCNACSALCCVVLPFDADQGFGFDKPALTPCQHLKDDFTCGIHTELAERHFTGCIHYGCHGAGQRVTRVFGEFNWRSHPDKANEIYSMFSHMHRLHALQALLQTAIAAVSAGVWQQKLVDQQQQIEALCQQLERQEAVEMEAAITQAHTLLRQLATQPDIVALKGRRDSGAV